MPVNPAERQGKSMHVSELKNSRFLKQQDVGEGLLVTIAGVDQGNVNAEGAEEQLKWLMHFEELEKPLVLNSVNGQLLAKITGSEESEGWIGKKVVLYNDPNVSFAGKLTGGIRIRAPKKVVTAQSKAQANYINKQAKAQPQPQPDVVADVVADVDGNAVSGDNLPF